MKWEDSKVFVLAETQMNIVGRKGYLEHLGVPEWDTDATSAAEELTEIAGKTCYMSFSKDLNKNLTKIRDNSNEAYIQNGLIDNKHFSVLEHSTVTFAICNVSRVFTHELVRHRAGTAFSQESGRYVRIDDLILYKPDCLSEPELESLEKALNVIEGLYEHLCGDVFNRIGNDFTEKKKVTSALRRMLPEGRTNTIIFTANHNALRHIINMRTSEHAEEEISLVFGKIKAILIDKFPHIYKDYV